MMRKALPLAESTTLVQALAQLYTTQKQPIKAKKTPFKTLLK